MEQLKLVGQVCSVVSSIRSLKKTNKLISSFLKELGSLFAVSCHPQLLVRSADW